MFHSTSDDTVTLVRDIENPLGVTGNGCQHLSSTPIPNLDRILVINANAG